MTDVFTLQDLDDVGAAVAAAWRSGADRDWTVRAGTLDWSCTRTAVHAVDTLFAPAFFLAARRTDRYPAGMWSPGATATPRDVVDGVEVGVRVLAAVVVDAPADAEALLFRAPPTLGRTADFAPRGALELVLHAHDVCTGLGVDFAPPHRACDALRRHVRDWPMWGAYWPELSMAGDPWTDLLITTGRRRGVGAPTSPG